MNDSDVLGPLLALTSAVVWGAGDFCGGLAGRKLHSFQVSAIAALTGLLLVLTLAFLLGEPWPSSTGALWALAGGSSGGLGIALLYRGLANGSVPIVASVSSFVGAAVPVLVGAFLEGAPGWVKFLGFALGLVAIVLISFSGNVQRARAKSSTLMGFLAGLGFGGFFIGMARAETVFTSLVLARLCTLGIALGLMALLRKPFVSPLYHPVALLSGILDAAGNMLYVIAKQYTRLDVAAVLSSLYPASTIVLAAIFLKEQIGPRQWIGVALCLISISLIVA